MKYIEGKKFVRSLQDLDRKGGQFSKVANKIFAVIGKLDIDEDPFKGLKATKHGESRIKSCRKYDLGNGCRLITVNKDGNCFLLYAGSHDDCDRWLERNRGFTPSVNKDGNIIETFQSNNLDPSVRIIGNSDFSHGRLFEKLEDEDFDFLVEGVSRRIVRNIEALESINEEEEIYRVVKDVEDEGRRKSIYDTFVKLRQGDIKAAANCVASLRGDIVSPEPDTEIKDSEDFHVITTNSPRELEQFEYYIRNADYRDWMMFMHPEQQRMATAEFSGPTKLTGVSGSGKTCIVVKRAITLAERYPDGKILVLTLNRPLAGLIQDLVLSCCAFPKVRDRIKVVPFFELCQEFLGEFEPKNKNIYDDQTWKTKEHIDDVWREYYRLELNNRGAECMLPVHDSLISQGIDAERYIREEFDWIRSAMSYNQRERYLDIERSGRSYPLLKEFRSMLLNGLEEWEDKMRDVGITDYLGVATALYHHRDKLQPNYRCILIDECQDFGTIELELVVVLAEDGPDNLFFCGDAAQHVSWKHQSFKGAGIFLPGARSRKIDQNYRNSRNILQVAYEILCNNLTEEMIEKEDFEILDPKFANFSGPMPLRLKADLLEDEIAYATAYARSELEGYPNRKACIAICGYTLQQIQELGNRNNLPVLEGTLSIEKESLFLSDLEQTKGFEFDLVCIVNASKGVIPNPATPSHEQFRDLSKLYVAMTRAKLKLILSYSGDPSPYLEFNKADEYFRSEIWEDSFGKEKILKLGVPPDLDELHEKHLRDDLPSFGNMKVEEFLYTPQARKLSLRLIRKLRDLVRGKSRNKKNPLIKWRKLSEIVEKGIKYPNEARKHFGPAYEEFQELVERLDLH